MKTNKQTWLQSHAETLTQNIAGLLIGFIILSFWGLTPSESVSLQAVIFLSSYARGYIIRRLFNEYGGKND